jgi:membrane-bound lytic murein transglycosylase B
VQTLIKQLVSEHGFHHDELSVLFNSATRQQSVLDAISRPAERTLEWHEYRKIFVTAKRIEQGLEFWRDNSAALARAHSEFGVAPEYVVAIIGVETRYGRTMGRYRVIDALTTLAFDYPPRADFFRSELVEYLLLVREEGFDPLVLLGSYAGAMGYGQFISSSMRNYAVDFDGDGRRDILTNKVDAIGSVANYFRRHGWRGDAQVIVPAALKDPTADKLANQGLELVHKVSHLAEQGVESAARPASAQAALMRMQTEQGPRYWVALNDFYAITRYNHSAMYALAVHQLATALRAAR